MSSKSRHFFFHLLCRRELRCSLRYGDMTTMTITATTISITKYIGKIYHGDKQQQQRLQFPCRGWPPARLPWCLGGHASSDSAGLASSSRRIYFQVFFCGRTNLTIAAAAVPTNQYLRVVRRTDLQRTSNQCVAFHSLFSDTYDTIFSIPKARRKRTHHFELVWYELALSLTGCRRAVER